MSSSAPDCDVIEELSVFVLLLLILSAAVESCGDVLSVPSEDDGDFKRAESTTDELPPAILSEFTVFIASLFIAVFCFDEVVFDNKEVLFFSSSSVNEVVFLLLDKLVSSFMFLAIAEWGEGAGGVSDLRIPATSVLLSVRWDSVDILSSAAERRCGFFICSGMKLSISVSYTHLTLPTIYSV